MATVDLPHPSAEETKDETSTELSFNSPESKGSPDAKISNAEVFVPSDTPEREKSGNNGHIESPIDSTDESPSKQASDAAMHVSSKRERKKVQRLSETLSKAHEEKAELRLKAVQAVTEGLKAGKGTSLGDIPLIELSIRKAKPVDLKGLHNAAFGRPGSVSEIRSNLRKFRGFPFEKGSKDYDKKITLLNQRPTADIRESLRLLHLEVSGSREQLVSRLVDFLLYPQTEVVKYKGKVPKRTGGRGRPKQDAEKSEKRRRTPKTTTSSKAASSEASLSSALEPTDDDGASAVSEISDQSESSSPKPVPKKRGRPPSASKAKTVKRRVVVGEESDHAGSDNLSSPKESVKKAKVNPKAEAESEEEAPLSAFTAKKKSLPTDEELKTRVIGLLKNANLEETSLKHVRNQIFSQYPDVDLSSKKDFITATVKDYLSQS